MILISASFQALRQDANSPRSVQRNGSVVHPAFLNIRTTRIIIDELKGMKLNVNAINGVA